MIIIKMKNFLIFLIFYFFTKLTRVLSPCTRKELIHLVAVTLPLPGQMTPTKRLVRTIAVHWTRQSLCIVSCFLLSTRTASAFQATFALQAFTQLVPHVTPGSELGLLHRGGIFRRIVDLGQRNKPDLKPAASFSTSTRTWIRRSSAPRVSLRGGSDSGFGIQQGPAWVAQRLAMTGMICASILILEVAEAAMQMARVLLRLIWALLRPFRTVRRQIMTR